MERLKKAILKHHALIDGGSGNVVQAAAKELIDLGITADMHVGCVETDKQKIEWYAGQLVAISKHEITSSPINYYMLISTWVNFGKDEALRLCR